MGKEGSRRRHDAEFKKEAVRLVVEKGLSVKKVAEDVGLILRGKMQVDLYHDIREGLLAIGVRLGETIVVIGANTSVAVWTRRDHVKIEQKYRHI